MDTYIVNSTASSPLGLATGRKIFRIPVGQYANRIVVLYAATASTIALVWADPPYDSFSAPITVVNDSDDLPFDACMNDSGDIFLAYTIGTSRYLGFVKLTFNDGVWSIGSPVIVYNADENRYPSICKLSSGYLWIAYTRISGGLQYTNAKVSGDDGASWGLTSDPGDTLTSGSDYARCTMLEAGIYQYVFYNDGGDIIAYRRKLNTGIMWNSEVVLASSGGYTEDLAAGMHPDGRIGVAYASTSGLFFREYSGSAWSGEYTLINEAITSPNVVYRSGIPYVLFSRTYGDNMTLPVYTKKVDTVFQSPAPIDNRKSYLKALLVYDASAGTYQDKTAPASSPDTADIFHSTSGTLVSAVNDAVFFGMDEPFHLLSFLLSTVGAGGEVIWKYWDGQNWKSFTPESGVWQLSTAQKTLLLWTDQKAVPGDWQKKEIAGTTAYWVSATVQTAFTTAPIGSQISALSEINAFTVQV